MLTSRLVRSVRGRIPDLPGDVWRQTLWEAGHRGWFSQHHIEGARNFQAPIMFWQAEERGTGCEEAAPRLQRQVLKYSLHLLFTHDLRDDDFITDGISAH